MSVATSEVDSQLLLQVGASMNESVSTPELRGSGEAAAAPAVLSPQTGADASKARAAGPVDGLRRRRLTILAMGVIVCGVAYGAYWFFDARYFESTDDSYVDGDVVQITSEVPGTVIGLHVDDTQSVDRGQALLELDPADAQIALKDAEAHLGRAVRAVRMLFAQADQLRAEIIAREVALSQAERDHQRRLELLDDGAVSREEFQHTDDSIAEMRNAHLGP
jgi:membrane fusion protein (multidrug efflux system)